MTPEDFQARYKGKNKERYNKAVRAECAGGHIVLDALELWHHIRNRKRMEGDAEGARLAGVAEEQMHAIRDAMVGEIKARYHIGPDHRE